MVLLALSALSCQGGASEPRAQGRAEGSSGGGSAALALMDDPEALAAAERHPSFGGRALIALAEARVGTRSALVVWPAFARGASRPVSDDPMGVTMELTAEGTLVVVDAGWNPRDRTGRAVAQRLGTERFERVDRAQGAALEELPGRISSAFEGFRAACRAGDRAAATRAARAMAALFAWEVVAYEDVVTEMLWAASTGDYELSHGRTERLHDGQRARITAVITYRGAPHTIAVIAAPRGDGTGRWVITGEDPAAGD